MLVLRWRGYASRLAAALSWRRTTGAQTGSVLASFDAPGGLFELPDAAGRWSRAGRHFSPP